MYLPGHLAWTPRTPQSLIRASEVSCVVVLYKPCSVYRAVNAQLNSPDPTLWDLLHGTQAPTIKLPHKSAQNGIYACLHAGLQDLTQWSSQKEDSVPVLGRGAAKHVGLACQREFHHHKIVSWHLQVLSTPLCSLITSTRARKSGSALPPVFPEGHRTLLQK